MSDNSDKSAFPAVKVQLEQNREEAIQRIVARARTELPDYRQRDINELSEAVARSYDNWCESVLKNNVNIAKPNSEQAIQENIAQHRDPAQVARTPWLIYEVALQILDEAGNKVQTQERTEFSTIAHKLTNTMATVGQFKIARHIVEQASHKFKA